MIELEQLHREILACRACLAAGYMIEPPPLVWGQARAPFMLIGQAPSRTDLLQRHMYSGPAAQKLLSWLRLSGFADDDFGTTLYMTALTKCFPGRLPGKSTDRAPSARELLLCSDWLIQQVNIVQPSVIILFGKMAIDRFLGPGSMTERIGETFDKNGTHFIPLPHSSGASTWLNDADNRSRLEIALQHVRSARLKYG